MCLCAQAICLFPWKYHVLVERQSLLKGRGLLSALASVL